MRENGLVVAAGVRVFPTCFLPSVMLLSPCTRTLQLDTNALNGSVPSGLFLAPKLKWVTIMFPRVAPF